MRNLPLAVVAIAVMAFAAAGCGAPPAQAQSAVAFLAQNALSPGVNTLPSGVQYTIVKSGPATGAHPAAASTVTVNYEGSLVSGEVFDSSYKRGTPSSFGVGAVIDGWTEALQLMRPGDEWMLYIPPSQGYGNVQKGPIPPGSVLIFRVELLSIDG
jgi:peptidylprolyl isomerase/FKBP-type peptidyl-prolyl cis-trans isomerase FklB